MTQAPLTALERELLGYVEQLTTTSAQSASVLLALEKISNEKTQSEFLIFIELLSALVASQLELASFLNDLVNKSANLEQTSARLRENLTQLCSAEQELNRKLGR